MKINCCWLYAISKYGYPPSLRDTFKVIEEIANLGFENFELEAVGEKNLNEIYNHKNEIRQRCDNQGLKVINFCPIFREVVSFNKKERRKSFDLYKKSVELANYFECYTIQIDSYTPPLQFEGPAPYSNTVQFNQSYRVIIDPAFDWQKQWNILVESISYCASLADQAGLKFCLEPRVGEMISNSDAILRLMDAVNNPNFGAVLDTGHLHAQKEILPLSVEKLGRKIFYVHVADNEGLRNDHLPLGEGNIDWEGVFISLKKHEFSRYVGIDIGRIENLDEGIIRSKEFLEKLFKKMGI